MVERIRTRMEQVEQALEDERRSTNTKIKETKNIIDNNIDTRTVELRRLLEKQLNDSQQNLDQ